MTERSLRLTLNGRQRTIAVPLHWTLLQLLRDRLQAYDVKYGCGEGACGACVVLVDGEPVSSCLELAVRANNRELVTVQGVAPELKAAFVEHGAVQCGFCTPGMLLTAAHLLRVAEAVPSRDEIRAALAANLCRCTGYRTIVDAVEAAARDRRVTR
jgi:aerobic carbon-monoxide dehydrogenase small subunit